MVSQDAASIDGFLTQDALYEILLRVPARPLCRFRTVCRSWRSLLSDPQFAAAHAAHHRGDPPLFAVCVAGGAHDEVAEIKLLDTSGHTVKRLSVGPTLPLHEMLPHLDKVLLRGLVQLQGHAMRVLDPATGTVSILRRNIPDSCNSIVFGRAMSSTGGHAGEYKVLSLDTSLYATQPCKVKVLTLLNGGGGTWRSAPMPPVTIKTFHNRHKEVAVANGVVYHLVDNTSWLIAAFDLEAEQWQPSLLQGPVPVPTIDGYAQPLRSLAELNGRLAAVSSTALHMNIWLLMDSGKWHKQCRVRMCIQQHIWPFAKDVQPLWLLDDGRVALWGSRGGMRSGALWMYDPRTGMCTEVAAMENCLRVGVGVYTGNLLQQVDQAAHVMEKP
ncbi:unnamed protein product [Urochloa decumbens]|uniref:F-box domain-containing protein n=1 Tax=Urochloa decumbens TaxID=240449 RepID=A0ABC9FP55_9POAL